jgi:hypothetical protein
LSTPPLCEYWQLSETGPRTYDLAWLLDAHEALDELEAARKPAP